MEDYEKDPAPSDFLKQVKEGVCQSTDTSIGDCEEDEGRLQYTAPRFVLDLDSLRLEILHSQQNSPSARHLGTAKSFELVSREYYWPLMMRCFE